MGEGDQIDEDLVQELLDDFKKRRLDVIRLLLKEVEEGRITDRDGVLEKEILLRINEGDEIVETQR